METRAIWALAGGKGGAGRTLLTANLGIHLARSGRRVVAIDLDLQGAALHLALGFARVRRGLAGLLDQEPARLEDLAADTAINHLRLIGGLSGSLAPRDPEAIVRRVGELLTGVEADHVLLDCGSGRSPATLAAFGLASMGIVVTTPEPQALEAAGLFAGAHLRCCLERALPADTRRALDELLAADGVAVDRLSFRALMIRLGGLDPGARDAVAAVIRRTRLELLLNQLRDESDEEAGAGLASGFRKAFGLELPIAGLVEHDPSVLQAVHKRRPLSQQFPNTPATKGIGRAAGQLLAASAAGAPTPAEEWEDLAGVDHYRVLEIVPKASSREIQSSYHILKKAYDPETSPLTPILDADALRSIQGRVEEAYRTLIFLESRVVYDRHLLEAGHLRAEDIRGLHAEMGSPAAPAPPAPPTPAAAVAALPTQTERPQEEASVPADVPAGASAAAAPPPEAAGTDPATPPQERDVASIQRPVPVTGEALRAERLRLGQTLEGIASRTKIRQTYLQAIEEERFDALPPPVFLRGFVREFASCLGLPADDVARAFLKRREQAIAPAAAAEDPDRRSA